MSTYPKIRGSGIEVQVQLLFWRTDADLAKVQGIVLNVFGRNLTFASFAAWGCSLALGAARRRRLFALAENVVRTHAAANSTVFALLCEHLGLEVRTRLGGMEAICKC